MAKHEVVIRENTGTTKTDAPYLPLYIKKSDLAFAALCAQVAAESGLTDTQVRAIFEGAFAEFETLEQDAAVRIHVDGMTVCMAIYGSFATADAAFDPEKNTLALAIYLDDDIKNALVNVTPTIVTDETATKVRITGIADEAMPRPYDVIHGQGVYGIQGYNLILTDSGAEAYLENAAGAKFPCVVDEAVSKQLLRVHTATLLEAGDYKQFVKSRGGDSEGTLQTQFRRVKYLKIAPTAPTITKVTQDGKPDNTVLLGPDPWTVNGTGLARQTGDEVWVELYSASDPTERIDEGDNTSLVTSWTDTAINLSKVLTNTRQPDGAWWNAYPRTMVVLIRGGVRHEFPMTFVGG